MNFTAATFLPLLPIVVLSFTTVILMLAIAIKRDHAISFWITVAGFLLSLLSLQFTPAFADSVPTPVTGLLLFDNTAYFYTLLMLFAGLVCAFFLRNFLLVYSGNREEVYLLLLIAVIGGLVLVASSHMASFFIGLELLSVPVYGMVAYNYERNRALEAGVKYLILSAAASAFMLFGMALVYAQVGTLSLVGLSKSVLVADSYLAGFGVAMIAIAMCFKLSLAPFHLWTPDVYQGAPAPVGALLATVSKVAVLAVLIRLLVQAPVELTHFLQPVFIAILVLSIVVGNLLALTQDNVKRMLAYSSIAHMGYLFIPLAAGVTVDVQTVNVYLLAYVVTTLGAFGAISAMSRAADAGDGENIANFRGLFWRNPYLGAAMVFVMLSLAGIPLTTGFIGKFYVFMTAVNASSWVLLAALVVGSGVGLYYYLRLMISLFSREPNSNADQVAISRSSVLLVVLMAVLIVWLGVYPQPALEFISALK
ncbi:NADH-quinone oxidoreductase subunit N [Cellvibrio sp. KY-GH-1]|uniref:NADH-quinone oxidoreductase subunit N n=1 Tax=Cellvibrio sp. KY-GH-1 TaxID=2303332 RepID=UPI001248F3BC|nr:NADH-quinone oxidoreductase subunit N [Cellvibrio sp. KY-GH-1]QEY15544.1 NADH-quinone oxidoreductase subunit N [Cellvibrio sp. KY-GH-1]